MKPRTFESKTSPSSSQSNNQTTYICTGSKKAALAYLSRKNIISQVNEKDKVVFFVDEEQKVVPSARK